MQLIGTEKHNFIDVNHYFYVYLNLLDWKVYLDVFGVWSVTDS